MARSAVARRGEEEEVRSRATLGVGLLFGLLGALLIVLEGLWDLVLGAVILAFGHVGFAFGTWSQGLVFVLLGLVLGGFALFGRSRGGDRSLAAGVVMVVVPVLGFALLGFLDGVLVLVGAVFVLIGGLLYLVASR
jgi:hypothetical protein